MFDLFKYVSLAAALIPAQGTDCRVPKLPASLNKQIVQIKAQGKVFFPETNTDIRCKI